MESPPSLHISVQIVAILKKKGKKDHDIFISIVNKLEHTDTRSSMSCLQL